MPLIQGKSKEAQSKNIATEINAGKPPKQAIAISYAIKRRNKHMAKGGMAHCAHGGPAHCSMGCYADGGVVEEMHPEHDEMSSMPSAKAAEKALAYEEGIDEQEKEMPNMPRHEKPVHMNSEMAREEGDMESEDEPMKMAKGGFMHPKMMAKMIRMAKGGMVSADAWKAAEDRTHAIESHSGDGMDNEDIDVAWTTPHDDNLSSEGDYPLMEEEGYEEGHQAKMRRKGGLLDHIMSKLHSR